jgi:acyl carrier protein
LIDIEELLFEICEDPRVRDSETDLFETGIMDSYAMIELFSRLEEEGIELHMTRIDRSLLRTPAGIRKLIENAQTQEDRGTEIIRSDRNPSE